MRIRSLLRNIYNISSVTIGFILSPLSWWNDLFVNIPISYLFSIPFGLINRNLFIPMFIIGYWGTNIVGIIMMHHGFKNLIKTKDTNIKNKFKKMLIISTLYTLLIVILIVLGILKFPTEYLPKNE